MTVQVRDLRLLQLDLFIQINFLLSDDIQLSNLIVNDLLSLLERIVDFFDLVLDFFDLLLRVLDHLVKILDLSVQMVRQLLLLGLLKVVLQKSLSLKHELGLLLTDCSH